MKIMKPPKLVKYLVGFFTLVLILQCCFGFPAIAKIFSFFKKNNAGFNDVKHELKLPNQKNGKNLFFGEVAFKNGGQACIYCHNVKEASSWGREKLGPPLEDVKKDYTKAKLISSLINSHWIVMKTVYKNKPLTEEEAVDVVAYLETLHGE